MSNRRKLRPSETARQDQYLAGARRVAREPHTAVFVTQYAEQAIQCSWCDCADDAPEHTNGRTCAGCPLMATYVMHTMYGTPEQVSYPICEAHQPDATRHFTAFVTGHGVPVEIHGVDILDEDR